MRSSQALFVLLLLASLCFPAYVYGDIYGPNLEKINKTRIAIEGSFSYALVTDRGNYSFFLPDGDYKISASEFDDSGNLLLYEEQQITVGSDDQRIDLVLKPPWRMEFFVYPVVLVFLVLVFVWANRHWNKKITPPTPSGQPGTAPPAIRETKKIELDDEMKTVLGVLAGHEGRATQKELKEALGFSDAKLSLILAELEEGGFIKKFKRGRGNIIRKL